MSYNIRVFDLKEDKKVNAKCLLIDISIDEYVELIKEHLDELPFQRRKILSRKRGVYKRLTQDLKENALIPPISLIIRKASKVQKAIKDTNELKNIERQINEKIKNGDLLILDGLQRTYCMLNVIEELKDSADEKKDFCNTRIRAELWYNIKYTAILYKMLVLNTGQVKMSMRHQIEILNIPLRDKISEIASTKGVLLKFSTYRDKSKRVTNDIYNYKFSNIIEGLTAFITQNPIVDKTNEVVKELERMKFVEEHSDPKMLSKEEEIQEFTEILIKLDEFLWRKYKDPLKTQDEEGKEVKLPWTSRKEIMNSSPILAGIFASFGKIFGNDRDKYTKRGKKFFQILESVTDDPLKLEIMSDLLQDEKGRSAKFGETTRNFFFHALMEFFNGEDDFEVVWGRAAT